MQCLLSAPLRKLKSITLSNMTKYQIVRIYRPDLNRPTEVVRRGLSLKEARAHCNNEATRTKNYFDGYDRETV